MAPRKKRAQATSLTANKKTKIVSDALKKGSKQPKDHLSALPAELRLMIYEAIFPDDEEIRLSKPIPKYRQKHSIAAEKAALRRRKHPERKLRFEIPSFLQVCHRFRVEASPIFMRRTVFVMSFSDCEERHIQGWLQDLGQHAQYLRRIAVHYGAQPGYHARILQSETSTSKHLKGLSVLPAACKVVPSFAKRNSYNQLAIILLAIIYMKGRSIMQLLADPAGLTVLASPNFHAVLPGTLDDALTLTGISRQEFDAIRTWKHSQP